MKSSDQLWARGRGHLNGAIRGILAALSLAREIGKPLTLVRSQASRTSLLPFIKSDKHALAVQAKSLAGASWIPGLHLEKHDRKLFL